MTREEAIKVLLDEWKCIDRNDGINCDRKCEKCDLVMDSAILKEAYNMAIKALEQEPCDDDYQTDMDEAWKQAKREPCDDVVSRQAVEKIINDIRDCISVEGYCAILERLKKLPPVRPQEQTGKCRTCKYGEIYNDLWCKCHDPLLDGIMVKMTEKCRAEEIIDLNRKYKAERSKDNG